MSTDIGHLHLDWQRVEVPEGMRPVYTRCSYCGRQVDPSDPADVLLSIRCDEHERLSVDLGPCCLGKPRGRWQKCIELGCETDGMVWVYRPPTATDPGGLYAFGP